MNTEAAAQLIQILEKTVSPGKRRSRSTPNGGMGEMSRLKNDGKRVCSGMKQAYTVPSHHDNPIEDDCLCDHPFIVF